ncbi:MAG: hypothetical protein Q8Q22_00325, partial [bacterium]|nr:hypothetical protein [bacterium]
VSKSGTGSGTVTSVPAGIDCGSSCSASYTDGTSVTLTATPSAGSTFTSWAGACTGTGSCTISMTAARAVTATFNLNSYTLTTSIDSGLGTISSSGISCPGDCSESYTFGQWASLIATPAIDYVFGSWTGSCAGQTGICSVLMDSNKTAGVNFTYVSPFNYSLSNSGTSNVTKTSGNAFTQNTITKNLITGSGSVTITATGMPSGVSVAYDANRTCSPSCSSTITFTVAPSTPTGTYPITVTGSPLNKQTNFNLVVSGNPMTVSCSASPSPALLGQTVTWTAVVSGGTAPFTYSWSGTNIPVSPAPNTNPFSIVYSTLGQKTATVTATDTDSVQANCPTGIVQINFNPDFEEF